MADTAGVNSAYAAASKLFDLIVLIEKKPDENIDRSYILSLYSECLTAVRLTESAANLKSDQEYDRVIGLSSLNRLGR